MFEITPQDGYSNVYMESNSEIRSNERSALTGMVEKLCSLAACGAAGQKDTGTLDESENSSYESAEGIRIKMITENTEVIITLNDSRAAADLVSILPLKMSLIERNSFAKGMTLPEHFSAIV